MLNNILRNFVVWVDGAGKMGDGDMAKLPDLSLVLEDYRGGGMDIAIEVDLGMEKLEAEFSLTAFDPQVITLFGLSPGTRKAFTMRGHVAGEDGVTFGVAAYIRGRIKKIVHDNWEPGGKAKLTTSLAVDYYKLKHGDRTLVEIDPFNYVRSINGVDQLAAARADLGF